VAEVIEKAKEEKKVEEILKTAKLPADNKEVAKIIKQVNKEAAKDPEVAVAKIEEKAQAKIVKTIETLKEEGKEVTPKVVAKVVKKVEKEKEAEKAVVKVIAKE